ncbi:helix-turn-helix domain-containing protein [Yersinia thracica]|uniref:helix-turn-helix domain-containing protein n=1 Tax=Yersinia thracica TaxID=2890319 RepID=UPI00157D702D|nr:helix-turn-helix domain-containing protein [Yersinia thracica]
MTTCLSIIKNDEQYEDYMSELTTILDSGLVEGTAAFERFEMLSLLIEDYESKNYKIDKPSPIDAIKFRMDQLGLSQSDMTQYLGSKSKVSEVLSGKRKLSLSMIKRLHDGLGIPVDILIQDTNAVEWSYIDTLNKTVELDDNISQEDPLSTFTYINPLIKYPSRASIGKLFSRRNAPRISNALVAITVNGKSVTSELTNHLTSTLSNDVFSRLS